MHVCAHVFTLKDIVLELCLTNAGLEVFSKLPLEEEPFTLV